MRSLQLDTAILLRIEARTGLADVWQVAMTENQGIRIVELQRTEQHQERALLRQRPRVGIIALFIESALVADAQRVLVVTLGVGPDEVLVTRLVQPSVARDIVVVAGVAEACGVIFNELLQGVGPVAARGATVNDNEVDTSHNISN